MLNPVYICMQPRFMHETDCHAAVYASAGASTRCPELSFLLALLNGSKRKQPAAPLPPCGPGPLGCKLALKYASHLLLKDFKARWKVGGSGGSSIRTGGSPDPDHLYARAHQETVSPYCY